MSDLLQNGGVVDRLFGSLAELERAIAGAKMALLKRGSVPKEVFDRLDSYSGILTTQRRLANELAQHVKNGNTLEVGRHVGLINGLSAMIIDDARSILASLSEEGQGKGEPRKDNFC